MAIGIPLKKLNGLDFQLRIVTKLLYLKHRLAPYGYHQYVSLYFTTQCVYVKCTTQIYVKSIALYSTLQYRNLRCVQVDTPTETNHYTDTTPVPVLLVHAALVPFPFHDVIICANETYSCLTIMCPGSLSLRVKSLPCQHTCITVFFRSSQVLYLPGIDSHHSRL